MIFPHFFPNHRLDITLGPPVNTMSSEEKVVLAGAQITAIKMKLQSLKK